MSTNFSLIIYWSKEYLRFSEFFKDDSLSNLHLCIWINKWEREILLFIILYYNIKTFNNYNLILNYRLYIKTVTDYQWMFKHRKTHLWTKKEKKKELSFNRQNVGWLDPIYSLQLAYFSSFLAKQYARYFNSMVNSFKIICLNFLQEAMQ